MKIELIPNWRQAAAMWSVRLSVASGLISTTALGIIGAYALLPADWLPAVGAGFKAAVSYAALGAAGVTAFTAAFARIVDQPGLRQ